MGTGVLEASTSAIACCILDGPREELLDGAVGLAGLGGLLGVVGGAAAAKANCSKSKRVFWLKGTRGAGILTSCRKR